MFRDHAARGFTLIELGVVLVLIGLILGFAIPAVRHSTMGSQLGVAADGIVTQLALAREKAIDTQTDLVVRFAQDSLGADFHVRPPDGGVEMKWSLPPDVGYAAGSARGVTILRDGRAAPAVVVVLMDREAHLDTVSVLASGMVVHP